MVSHLQWIFSRGMHAAGNAVVLAAALGWGCSAFAGTIVNDTWRDGERYQPAGPLFVPAPPPYAENNGVVGTDADSDGDLESAWFRGGAGALDPAGAGGPLRLTQGSASSSSLSTFFTQEGSEVDLASAGDYFTVTWEFNVDGAVGANTSQGVRVALVNSPAAAVNRLTANGSPGDGAYAGYALFMNMNSAFSHSRPFELMERNIASGNLLSSGGNWLGLVSDGTNGNTGYAPGNTYTLTMTLTRTIANELQIDASMVGGNLDNVGSLSVSHTDATPNSFKFDLFQFRPDGNDVSYNIINTSLFRVHVIPEPATISLLGLVSLAVVGIARRRR